MFQRCPTFDLVAVVMVVVVVDIAVAPVLMGATKLLRDLGRGLPLL